MNSSNKRLPGNRENKKPLLKQEERSLKDATAKGNSTVMSKTEPDKPKACRKDCSRKRKFSRPKSKLRPRSLNNALFLEKERTMQKM